MEELFIRPNPILELFRSKDFWLRDHWIDEAGRRKYGTISCTSNGLHHAVACGILAHDVVAVAWLEIHQVEKNQYSLQLYATRKLSSDTIQNPNLIWQENFSDTNDNPQEAIQSLCARFDRLDVTKKMIFLRDHTIIADPRNAPYPQHWKQFPWPIATDSIRIQPQADAA